MYAYIVILNNIFYNHYNRLYKIKFIYCYYMYIVYVEKKKILNQREKKQG